MGPRPDGRGRADIWGVSKENMKERQWGRGRMAAEGQGGRHGRGVVPLRQWGRGRMAAEGRPVHHAVRRAAVASMGPRPDGRGRFALALLLRLGSRRQWGRGRMAAEGSHACTAFSTFRCVNGAAAGWPRKALRPPSQRSWSNGVNGAAAGWPRKGAASPTRRLRRSSVNGAAAGWPRKAVIVGFAHWSG